MPLHADRVPLPDAVRVFAFGPVHPGRPCASHSFERWLFTGLMRSQRLAAIAAASVLLPSWAPGLSRTAPGRQHGPRLHELRLRLREPGPHTLHVFFTESHVARAPAVLLLAGGTQPRGARGAAVLPGLGEARWIHKELAGFAAAGTALPVLGPDGFEAVRAEDRETFSGTGTGTGPGLIGLGTLDERVDAAAHAPLQAV